MSSYSEIDFALGYDECNFVERDFARDLDDTLIITQECSVMHPDSDTHVVGCHEYEG
jgi:hypothetical protein